MTVAYLIAAATNLVGLYGSYAFAEALRTDLLRMTAGSPLTETRTLLDQHSYASQRISASQFTSQLDLQSWSCSGLEVVSQKKDVIVHGATTNELKASCDEFR